MHRSQWRTRLSFIVLAFGLLTSLVLPSAPSASAQTSGPTITGFTGVVQGQTLKGTVTIEALVSGSSISKVVFTLSGPKSASNVEKIKPYEFLGKAWDTTIYPNGTYTLKATVSDTSNRSASSQIGFSIANGVVATPTATAKPATATATAKPATATATAKPATATATATAQAATATPTVPANTLAIYSDALSTGWANWSWGSTVNLAATAIIHGGSRSIATTYSAAWGALYLHANSPISTSGYSTLRFWVHGGSSGGQKLRLCASTACNSGTASVAPKAGTWSQIDVPLSALGSPASIVDLVWQDTSGATQPIFYLDDIALVGSGGTTPTPTTVASSNGPTLQIDAAAGRKPISPEIYGMNFPNAALAQELRLPVQRMGGNATTRYNWKNDTSNRASDWFFENIPNTNSDTGALPSGSASDRFVEEARQAGGKAFLTIPLIGWTPKSRTISCAFPVSVYGAQQRTDPYRPDCGNGLKPDGTKITGNDPTLTSTRIDESFVQDWVRHLIGRYGRADQGGVAFYNLDNEPGLWNSTHRDVHPQGASYDELRDLTYRYGAAIKAVDPSAKTLGPAEWGWTGYFYSGKDQEPGGSWWSNPQDRNAHGGTAFTPWYLQQMKAYEQQNDVRILDYLDLHYYPQASGVTLAPAGDSTVQARRLRSTRSLWDPTYTDESWIGEPVRLIPRMREWVDGNYPGTRLAIGEYNWGALDSLNGALAQADVLGIFGREGLDLATLWSPPATTDPGAFAFRMFRNYDGQGGGFGQTSVRSASSDQEKLAVYAALRSDGALTLMIINKSTSDVTSSVALAGFAPTSSAAVYRYSGANLSAIVREADQQVTASGFTASFPKSSITMVVVR